MKRRCSFGPKDKSGRRPGFTVIELLIALSLFSVLLFILLSNVRGILDVLARDEKTGAHARELDIFFLKLERELESSIPFSPLPLRGGPDEIFFPALQPSSSLDKTGKRFVGIHYWVSASRLYREEIDVVEALEKGRMPSKGQSLEAWLAGVHGLSFQYAYRLENGTLEWQEEWNPEAAKAGLPSGIKIQLTYEGPEGALLSREKFFYHPAGTLSFYES